MQSNKILFATFLVALSATLYGFLGYLGTNVLREHTPLATMLFWRFLIAGLCMAVFVAKDHIKNDAENATDKQTLFIMFALGALGYAGSSGFYFAASRYTGTGLAMVIFFSYPLVIALISWMVHRKKLNFITIATLISMLVGLFLLRDSVNTFSLIGMLLGFAAAFLYACYVMGSKRFSNVSIDSNMLTMMVCFGCAFLYLGMVIWNHEALFPHTVKSWINLIAFGVLVTALPIQLMLEGLKHMSSMRASIISVLEPLVTVFVGVLLLNESMSHLQVLGAAIILSSALLVQFQREL